MNSKADAPAIAVARASLSSSSSSSQPPRASSSAATAMSPTANSPPRPLPPSDEHAQSVAARSESSVPEQSTGKLLLGHVRKNGFEQPFARDQVISWTGHSVSAVCFYVAATSFLVKGEDEASRGVVALTHVALGFHVPAFLLLVTSWISCESIDPSKDVQETLPRGWFGVKLNGPRWEKARYCAICRKTVPGLDHHCTCVPSGFFNGDVWEARLQIADAPNGNPFYIFTNKRSPLSYAAEVGDIAICSLLIEAMTDVGTSAYSAEENTGIGKALDWSDDHQRTPLSYAAAYGHTDICALLLVNGASFVKDLIGRMPLTYAAAGRHRDTCLCLIKQGASPDGEDDEGKTPLSYAACEGCTDICALLCKVGSSVYQKDKNGRTSLSIASEMGHVDTCSQLIAWGALLDDEDKNGSTPLRWAANLIQTDAEWKKQWTKDEVVCRRRLYENLRKDENLLRGLDDDRGKHNAVTLLDHEIRQTMDPEAEQHLQRVAGRLRRTCQFDIPTRPLWFISQEDVEFNKWSQIENSNGDTEYDGKWLETAVTIASTSLEVAKFEEATSRWYQLNHPHVRKLFGACHIASPPFLVYEHGTWLLEKLAVPGQQQLEWKYLHQAALGLQYLHERGIVHGNLRCHNIVIGSDGNAKVPGFGEHHIDDLKCDNVLIGMDGTAKLIDFGLSAILGEAEVMVNVGKMGAVNWRSPEYLIGERPSLASNAYSSAMCISEAVTGEIPWGGSMLDAVVKFRVKRGSIPRRPLSMSDKQWNLVELMTKSSPPERVTISYVTNKLFEFSETEKVRREGYTAAS
ncbi:Tkl protein kinase, partial [Globisporangium splendens]